METMDVFTREDVQFYFLLKIIFILFIFDGGNFENPSG